MSKGPTPQEWGPSTFRRAGFGSGGECRGGVGVQAEPVVYGGDESGAEQPGQGDLSFGATQGLRGIGGGGPADGGGLLDAYPRSSKSGAWVVDESHWDGLPDRHVPVDLTPGIRLGQQGDQDRVPRPVLAEASMTLPDRLPRPELRWQITPRAPCPKTVDRPLNQRAVGPHRPAHRPVQRRQRRLNPSPHLVRKNSGT